MQKIKILTLISVLVVFASCGSSQKDSTGKSHSSQEEKALESITSTLKPNESLVEYIFTDGQIPSSLIIDLFDEKMDLSNALNAYSLGCRFQHKEIDTQEQESIINDKLDKFNKAITELQSKRSNKDYVLCLGIVKFDDGETFNLSKHIYALDSENGKIEHQYLVNPGSIENAAIIENIKSGTFANYEINKENYNLDSLANTVSDPVLKFILEPIKEPSIN